MHTTCIALCTPISIISDILRRRHREQLMKDASEGMAARNHARLTRLAASRRVVVPPPDSDIYRQRDMVRRAVLGSCSVSNAVRCAAPLLDVDCVRTAARRGLDPLPPVT